MKWVSRFRTFYAFGCGKDEPSVMVVNYQGSVAGNNSKVNVSSEKLCAICLDSMCHLGDCHVFTAECSHQFHLSCIVSNVRHGSNNCPICRATWTYLPRNPNQANIRYEDDDPVDFDHTIVSLHGCPLEFSLSLVGCSYQHFDRFACLSVRLSSSRAPTDIVLVLTGNEMRLGLSMQAVALVISYLGPSDRLAVVSRAQRVLRLRRMTFSGKREATRTISASLGNKHQENGDEDLKIGMKILSDRVYRNPASLILRLSDVRDRSRPIPMLGNCSMDLQVAISEYNLRCGISEGAMMKEFGEYLEVLIGNVVRGLEVRMEGDERWKVGDVRVNYERKIMVNLGSAKMVRLRYRYIGGTAGVIYGEKLLHLGRGKETAFNHFDPSYPPLIL